MSALMREMGAKALRLGVPLGVQLDLTYRCNERCIHCYLDHDDHGEMTTAEILHLIDQLAAAGTFFLTLSGGEIFLRRDLFDIVERARKRTFSVKLKTNAVMVRKAKAERLAALGVDAVEISLYSHRPDVHDAITRLRGSFRRTLEGARLLKAAGLRVSFANVLMKHNASDYRGVQALATAEGMGYHVDPTITPAMDGDRGLLALNVDDATRSALLHDPTLVSDVEAFCAPPAGPLPAHDALDTIPCSAGHTACYISPYGDVYPCVQFPLACGNVRKTPFIEIWRNSPQLREVRSITLDDLNECSACVHGGACTRCPGLAYLEGDMRGASVQDCEKSLSRTGVPSARLLRGTTGAPPARYPVTWLVAR
jgi:radical SAM protein with 4Fe4S-binding SPASM domain